MAGGHGGTAAGGPFESDGTGPAARFGDAVPARKALEPAGGLESTPEMGPCIAAQACLPILNLGLDYYRAGVR